MRMFRTLGLRRKAKDIKRRYPDYWEEGEKLFFTFDRKRNPADRSKLERALFGEGRPGWEDSLLDGGQIRDALAPPDSHGPGVDLQELTEMEAKLYLITLDGFSPNEVTEMAQRVVEEVSAVARGGYPLGGNHAEMVMALGFLNAYMRRRLGVSGL